ncbi:MAG: hypothetical protein Q7S87_02915 [Agitococcus sp.]|nr:hypothetical protein [Agitococcus sp.]
MNNGLSRLVRVVEHDDKHQQQHASISILHYLNTANIVLLGEAGSGKTYTFKDAAAYEDARYFEKISSFFAAVEDDSEALLEETIYLDALDEFRFKEGKDNVTTKIVSTLRKIKNKSVRLSCRAADWQQNTDFEPLRSYFKENSWIILGLENLSELECTHILSKEGIANPSDFIEQAKQRGIEHFLHNPQTLIMLAKTVNAYDWPANKTALYEKATDILLKETNPDFTRSHQATHSYTAAQLKPVAGAICASLLLANQTQLSLHTEHNFLPCYTEIPIEDKQAVFACLKRRIFISPIPDVVSYLHRTVAEYLAATWLVELVTQQGFPLLRLQHLLGVDGYPNADLRGLYAWVTTLLNEQAPQFIVKDPYGILMYGDVAYLSRLNRKKLIHALEELSENDPYFRKNDWSENPLAALIGKDVIDEFKNILNDTNASFHLRDLVLNSILQSREQLPELTDDLYKLLSNTTATYPERRDALKALLKVTPNGEQLVIQCYQDILKTDKNSWQIRSDILVHLYNKGFTADDVRLVFSDACKDSDVSSTAGLFWQLSHHLPVIAIPDILDALSQFKPKDCDNITTEEKEDFRYEIQSAFNHFLLRVVESNLIIEPSRLWHWLKNLEAHNHSDNAKIIDILYNSPQKFAALINAYAHDQHTEDDFRYSHISSILGIPPIDTTSIILKEIQNKNAAITESDIRKYEICCSAVYYQNSYDLFSKLITLSDKTPQLKKIFERQNQSQLHDWYFKKIETQKKSLLEIEKSKYKDRENTLTTLASIKAGEHLKNLSFFADIYFGRRNNQSKEEKSLDSYTRLALYIGQDLVDYIITGFIAVLNSPNLHSVDYICQKVITNKYYPHWYTVLAGMDEAWLKTPHLNHFTENQLQVSLTLSITFPTQQLVNGITINTPRAWIEEIHNQRPDLAENTIFTLIDYALKYNKEYIPALSLLHQKGKTTFWHASTALSLLKRHPNSLIKNIKELANYILFSEISHELIAIAQNTITAELENEAKVYWLSILFILSPDELIKILGDIANKHQNIIWEIRDLLSSRFNNSHNFEVSYKQYEALISVGGSIFPNTNHPMGVTGGDRNLWDASDFIKSCITQLASLHNKEATDSLQRLIALPHLISYQNLLKHHLAEHWTIRRKHEFKSLSYQDVVRVLHHRKPASIADLYYLICDQLSVLKSEIKHSNTNTYESFWKAYEEETEIENYCRNRIIELLQPKLTPLDIRLEPETQASAEKRIDITAIYKAKMILPLELKRDSHSSLWTAWQNQLDRLYTTMPEANGYGIYLIFWFGEAHKSKKLTAPPKGITKPKTANELEQALQQLITNANKDHRLKVFVIDVEAPAQPKKPQTKKTT